MKIFFLSIFFGTCLFAKSPNVILIITDDQGYGDLSCHGNPILKTPHLDSLYEESIRLTDYHVSPTCAPTRSALLTGHWTNRTGVWHTIMGRSLLRFGEVTLADFLGKAGYETGMFGKWHLGDNFPYRPEDRGFDEVLRHGGGGVGQTPDYWDNAYFDGSYWHNGKPTSVKGFCTDVFFDYAIDFIESKKDSAHPFFVYLSTNAPHGPMHSPPSSSHPYQNLGTQLSNFFGMISNIDDNIGRLRAYLRENDLEENTILIFTTDNGTSSGEGVFNDGMRGKKGSEYDGGHRVPFFIYWEKGGLKGGRDISRLTAHIDVVPTLLDLCKIDPPDDIHFDGLSLRPLFFKDQDQNQNDQNQNQDHEDHEDRKDQNENDDDRKGQNDHYEDEWPDRILITDSQRVRDPIKWRKSSVMTQKYRMINGKELYDISLDPSQKRDIAAENPKVMNRLRAFYEAWWAELKPTFSQTSEIYLGHSKANPVALTSHDWISNGGTPWSQRSIRNAESRPSNTGFWAVKIVENGKYEVELRRWPREIDHPITASLPAGKPVSGAKAFREVEGAAFPAVVASLKLGGFSLEKPVKKGATSVSFRLPLQASSDELWAKFSDEKGNSIGAYYAYVKKLK